MKHSYFYFLSMGIKARTPPALQGSCQQYLCNDLNLLLRMLLLMLSIALLHKLYTHQDTISFVIINNPALNDNLNLDSIL